MEKIKLLYHNLLSEKTKKRSERVILLIAIASFLIHLLIIYLVDFGIISLDNPSDLLKNPTAAIYTPFSFILQILFSLFFMFIFIFLNFEFYFF